MFLLVSVLLACAATAPPEDKTFHSANGRFTLAVTVMKPTLTLRDGKKVVWALKCSGARGPEVAPECAALEFGADYRVADSGKWVAAVQPYVSELTSVVLLDARGKVRAAPVLEALDEEERQDFDLSSCGLRWLHGISVHGDVIDFTVHQGSSRRPTEPAGPTLSISLDANTGAVTRSPPIARPSIDALIAQHAAEKKPGLAFELLQRKAELQTNRGSPVLCGFFEKFIDDPDPHVRDGALQALWSARCSITGRRSGDAGR